MQVDTPSEKLLLRMLAAMTVFLVGAILALGITAVKARYLYPIGLPAIMLFYLATARHFPDALLRRAILGGSALAVLVVLAIRLWLVAETFVPSLRTYREITPYPALAAELERRGYAGAAFVVPDYYLAAHLIEMLSGADAIAVDTKRLKRPGSYFPGRRCVALSSGFDASGGLPGNDLSAFPRQRLDVTGLTCGVGLDRQAVWTLTDLGPDPALCRKYFGTAP